MEVTYRYRISNRVLDVSIEGKKDVRLYIAEFGNFSENQKLFDFLPIQSWYMIFGDCKLSAGGSEIRFSKLIFDGVGSGVSVKSFSDSYNNAVVFIV